MSEAPEEDEDEDWDAASEAALVDVATSTASLPWNTSVTTAKFAPNKLSTAPPDSEPERLSMIAGHWG